MKNDFQRHQLRRHVFLTVAVVCVVIILGGALGVSVVLYLSGGETGRDITLTWDASTSPNVGGYRIHYGPSSENYPHEVLVGNQTRFTLSGLDSGRTYYISVTAVDANSTRESDFSNEIVVTTP